MARQRGGKEDVTQTSDISPQHPHSWQRHCPKAGARVTTHFPYAALNSKLLTLEMQQSAQTPLGCITFSTLQLWP